MKKHTKAVILLSFLGLVGAGVVLAQTGGYASLFQSPMIVNVNPSGNVLIRGTVESVSTSTSSLFIRSWGGLWNVRTSSSTRFISPNNRFSDFVVGDWIGVQGNMNESSTTTTVISASLVRKWGRSPLDNDNDGIPDQSDNDDDNDGVPDNRDSHPFDHDNDDRNDDVDDDDDNDAIEDSRDNHRFDRDNDGTDDSDD